MKNVKNQRLASESEEVVKPKRSVPIREDESELAKRLKGAIGDEPVNAFARRCSLGESLMRSYLKGAMPSADRLVAMADTLGVTVDWLATGREPKLRADLIEAMQGIDKQRLQVAVSAVQEGLNRSNKVLSTEKHAELICLAYEAAKTTDRAFIVRWITAASM